MYNCEEWVLMIRFIQVLSIYGQLQSSVIKKMHENSTENSLHVNFGVNFSFSILLKGVRSSQLHSAKTYIGNQQMILKN